MKFLIIRFSSIGDIVLTTPVIRCLKKQIITSEIHYLTKKNYESIFSVQPYVDKIHFLQDNGNSLLEELKGENFDYIIDLHHNLRTWKLKRKLGKKSFSFNKLNIEKWIYVNFKVNALPRVHLTERYFKTIEQFGVCNDGEGLDYFIPEHEHVKEEDIPATHLAGYIGLVIGGAHGTKRYPLNKLKEFCKKIDHPVIILGGKEEWENGEELSKIDPYKIYNACGKFSLNESADLIRRSKLVITNDTGLMHIAVAFKKPVISLWGNTVPEFGMSPYYGKSQVPNSMLEIKKLSCRPCSKIGFNNCPLGHFKCMQMIDPGLIVSESKAILGMI